MHLLMTLRSAGTFSHISFSFLVNLPSNKYKLICPCIDFVCSKTGDG